MNLRSIIPNAPISQYTAVKIVGYNNTLKRYIIDTANTLTDIIIGLTVKSLTQSQDPESQNADAYNNCIITIGILYHINLASYTVADNIYATTSGTLTNIPSATTIAQVGIVRVASSNGQLEILIKQGAGSGASTASLVPKSFTCTGTSVPIDIGSPFIESKTLVFVNGIYLHSRNSETEANDSWTYEEDGTLGTITPRASTVSQAFPANLPGVVLYVPSI